tara:strand:+ start:55 stop:1515 length:1461 start_codon:yes stop_codon:yes gene_type:complete
MATVTIEQQPLFTRMPVGQKIIYTISESSIVAAEQRVKFVAKVYISNDLPPVFGTSSPIGTFKTIPNNKGVGIFDFSNLLSNYVSSDNLCTDNASYKKQGQLPDVTFPIHLIDRFSMSTNSCVYVAIIFSIEYLYLGGNSQTYNTIINTGGRTSRPLEIFNGYVKYTDDLLYGAVGTNINNNYGYDIDDYKLQFNTSNFLTNAPATQWVRNGDYGTLSYLVQIDTSNIEPVSYIQFKYYPEYDAGGTVLALDDQFDRLKNTGAYDVYDSKAEEMIIFFGAYPGNLKVYGTNFRTYLNSGEVKSYTIQAINSLGAETSKKMTINISCKNLRGYERVRLTWLNQYGTWDYYSFMQKSVQTISTKGTTYNQLEGTWNDNQYKVDSYKGGKKSFRVNATETIKMNSDYLSEEYSEWFEELINSPEVYMLKAANSPVEITSGSITFDSLNRFAVPVRLKTTSLTKKTVANDRLIQYTFEVEKSRTLRTQSV